MSNRSGAGAEKKGKLRHILAMGFPEQWEIGNKVFYGCLFF